MNAAVEGRSYRVRLDPAPARSEPPAGGAIGPGAFVTVEHEAVEPLDRNEAREEAIQVTNRVLHLLLFAGSNQKPVAGLAPYDVEDLEVDTGAGAPAPPEPPAQRRSVRVKFGDDVDQPAVQRLLDRLPGGLESAQALWNEAVQAYYEGRSREALIVVRASIEEGWTSAADAFCLAAGQAPSPLVRTELVQAYVESAKRARLTERLGVHTTHLFGRSIESQLPDGDWDRLCTALDERNKVAHTAGPADADRAWDGIRIARLVIEHLAALRATLGTRSAT
ncbi:MAG: hypothetical protein HY908_24485 [Myxococcales bacterium]|nr:hypothetical protein [Myxococcales bacterium]